MIYLGKRDLEQYLEKQDEYIKGHIHNERKEQVLHGNKSVYLKELEQKFTITPPTINFDKDGIELETTQRYVNVRPHPGTMMPTGDPKDVIVVKIPCEGTNEGLLQYMTLPQLVPIPNIHYEDEYVCFDVDRSSDNEQTMMNVRKSINQLNGLYDNFLERIDEYNGSLKSKIEQIYDNHKRKLEKDDELINQLKNGL